MRSSYNKNIISVFFLTPLIYSYDGDPYRAYEVLLVAIVAFFAFVRSRVSRIQLTDVIAVTAYSFSLLVQQLFLANGSVLFGTKFMVGTLSAAFPHWILRGTHWSHKGVAVGIRNGIYILFWIAFISIVTSFFAGVGERYIGVGFLGSRAFGYLGDSFSPIVVFLVLFFLCERKLVYGGACLTLLMMTGGKAALILAFVAGLIYVIFVLRSVVISVLSMISLAFFAVFEPARVYLFEIFFSEAEYSFYNRILSFEVGWNYFWENPIFGIGVNGALRRISEDVSFYAESVGNFTYYQVSTVHNAYLSTLAETGIIGFLFLMALVLFWIVTSIRVIRIARLLPYCVERSVMLAAAVWIIAFLISYQTTSWFFSGHPQLAWILMFSTVEIILAERVLKNIRL